MQGDRGQGIFVGAADSSGIQQRITIGYARIFGNQFNNSLVTGEFAEPVDFIFHQIDKRIEPVHTEGKLHQPFVEHIPPPVMDQFMKHGIVEIALGQLCIR